MNRNSGESGRPAAHRGTGKRGSGSQRGAAARADLPVENKSTGLVLDRDSYRKILDSLYEGLYFVDRDRRIRYWNKAAEHITGYTAEEVVGGFCSDNILTHVDDEGRSLCESACPLAMTIADGEARRTEAYLHHKDGHRVPIAMRNSTLTDTDGKVIGGVQIFSDISSVKASEARVRELEEMALLDNLTRVANRNFIQKELLMQFEEKKRFGISFGVLFMDIDDFKRVNDTFGHDIGDRVLKLVAVTLAKNSRPFDVIGRWGGEEFIGIIRNVTRRQLEHLGNRLRALVASSYVPLEGRKLQVTISIGATLVRDDDSEDTLLKRADTLLYESKQEGKNRLLMG